MKKPAALIAASLVLLLAGCSSDDNTPAPNNPAGNTSNNITQATIDASDYNTPAYFDFETGSTVAASDDWDIGFIRNTIIVNAGKKTAIADTQAEYYEADGVTPANNGQSFANATDASELPSLLNATSIIGDWVESGVKPAIDDSWYQPGVHPLQPSGQYFILKSDNGNSYAKMVVSDISPSYQVTLDFYVQASGDSAFAATANQWSINLASAGEVCYDFDVAQQVACTSAGWDIKSSVEGRNSSLLTNGGASGNADAAVYKLADTETEADYQHGDYRSADQSGVFPAAWAQDVDASIFADYSWYAYDPLNDGKHQLYSNYRVYVVDTDASDSNNEPYKLQITGYYNDSGSSGHYSIRFGALSVSE